MDNVIECKNLTHYYGSKLIFENMSFNVRKGSIFGLLGKNGTGKTTTINILNGFLQPRHGQCLLFGEDSQNLTPRTKARIGFLMEGHIQYSFMDIYQIERFYARFFPNWKKEPYFELMSKLEISPKQKISRMSCGQRSQVALGLILAQDPELMILDDYSMGLDPGYRRLFIDYLSEYAKAENKTIFVTSHIIQDLEVLIDEVMILGYRNILLSMSFKEFLAQFRKYKFEVVNDKLKLPANELIRNFELIKNHATIYSFYSQVEIEKFLHSEQIEYNNFNEAPMTLEDAFIGITGKY
ncbi:MAG: ABC transporter ATP-binding protein [Candidatus Zhuqueibacterota bacterium]